MRRTVAVYACVVALASCTTDRTRRGYLRANAATLGKPARPAIVIAGFGVTRLVDPVTKRHVWGTPHTMWRTRYDDDLDLDPNDRLVPGGWVGSRGPVNTGWQLSIALRKFGGYREGKDLFPTAVRVLARRDGTYAFYPSDLRENEKHLAPILFAPGDGTAVAGEDAMLFCSGHQGLAADPSVHRAMIRALRE